MDEILTRIFFDAHAHLRWGLMLRSVAEHTAGFCSGAVIMPNRKKTKPILNGYDVNLYRNEIRRSTKKRFPWFEPFMVVQITETSTVKDLKSAWRFGARAAKIFPKSVSNSEFGVANYTKLRKLLAYMEEVGMHLLLHGEHPRSIIDTMDAEKKFFPILRWIVRNFPELKITLEHVSTEAGIDIVGELYPKVACTLTCQHITKSMNDVIKQKVRVHNFCMPVLKYRRDMLAIRKAAVSGYDWAMNGGDSAPHTRRTKECAEGCAGVFNAPVQYQTLAEVFEEENAFANFEDFTSTRALKRYGLPITDQKVKLVRAPWVVPHIYGGVVPFRAGETIRWQLLMA
jgi:dihydroorotase